MASRLITSTDDPLYIDAMMHLSNTTETKTVLGTKLGWSDRWQGKIYCEEGCAQSYCPGHTLLVHKGFITKHPAWKYCVYHYESYRNGTNRAVMYFYEDEAKADAQANILRKRGRKD